MSQHDMDVANQTFPAYRADMNLALKALASTSSGATAPTTTFAYQLWLDTAVGDGTLQMRNAANDGNIEIGTLDESNAVMRKNANDIDISDAGGHYTGTEVEAALQEAAVITQGQHSIFVPAAAMTSRTTNGAADGSAEMTTNKNMVETKDFDTTTQEFAQFSVVMPKSWNAGTLVAQFFWSHPSTATNFGVTWGVQAIAIGDTDSLDVAFGTAQEVTDTGGSTDVMYRSAETGAITVGGSPGSEEYVQFQIYRDPADAGDNLAVDARLHGVRIHYTTNANNDT